MATQCLSRGANMNSDNNATVQQVVSITSSGTVFYLNPSSGTNIVGGTMPNNVSSTALMSVGEPKVVPARSDATLRLEPTVFTKQDLAQLLASSKKDDLPEWKLAHFCGDPLQWHERFGQFKSAIDSFSLTDDVKVTFLKILATGEAKTVIRVFSFCGTMYKDAMKIIESKFGQPQQ